MIIKYDEMKPAEIIAPRNGKGKAQSRVYQAMTNVEGKITAFNLMTLESNSAIGYHQHTINAEGYLLVEGVAKFNDNGEEYVAKPGDLMICKKGDSHAIEAMNGMPITFLAFIIESDAL